MVKRRTSSHCALAQNSFSLSEILQAQRFGVCCYVGQLRTNDLTRCKPSVVHEFLWALGRFMSGRSVSILKGEGVIV
jgi:hypothetical protein